MANKKTALAKTDNEFNAVVERLDKGNPKPGDVERLRTLLEDPEAKSFVWLNEPTLAMTATLVEKYSENQLLKETVKVGMKQKRKELNYADSPAPIRMLIDQMLLNQIRCAILELQAVNSTSGEHTHRTGIYWERRLNLAHKRYMASIEQLARVRRLLSEAAYFDAKASARRAAKTLNSVKLYNQLSNQS